MLLVPDNYNVTGAYLDQAPIRHQDQEGRPCVTFSFNDKGGQLFGQLTGSHLPDPASDFQYHLGIVLDGELCSAPSINSTIYESGEITGSFTQEEVQELVNVLNAGSLPAALDQGADQQAGSRTDAGQRHDQQAKWAMIIASMLVPLFMLVYYRFCGVVADIALVLNMLILFAIMLALKVAFTLTGLVGLALTVGMAVDNNVLVFERLREEQDRGATLRMAIRNAFHRAGTTIVDCNLTHLIAASVLFWLGTEQFRGFAMPLWIGVATSMYTSVFVAHVIFDVAEKRQWIAKANDGPLDRPYEHRLHGLGPLLHRRFRPDYGHGGGRVVPSRQGPVRHRFHRRHFGAGRCSTSRKNVAEVRDKLEKTASLKDLPDLAVSDVQTAGRDGRAAVHHRHLRR